MSELAYTTGHSKPIVVDWFNLIREVCGHSMENEPTIIATANGTTSQLRFTPYSALLYTRWQVKTKIFSSKNYFKLDQCSRKKGRHSLFHCL